MNFKLHSQYKPTGDQPEAIESLVNGFNQGDKFQTLLGVTGSGKTFTMANVIAKLNKPTMILSHNKTLAALMERKDVIVVCSVSAIYGLGEPETYLKMMLHVSVGEQITQEQITKRLSDLQYTRNDLGFARSTFRVRGDVIDIYPSDSDGYAVRLELFDDEIESIKTFDPLTGETFQKLARTTIFPKTHYVTPKNILDHAVEQIKDELNDRCQYFLENNKLLEEQRIRERTSYDIENYSRYLTGRKEGDPPPCLFDYLPKDGLLIIDESHVTVPQIGAMYKGDHSRKESLVNFGFRLPSAYDNRPLKFEEFKAT